MVLTTRRGQRDRRKPRASHRHSRGLVQPSISRVGFHASRWRYAGCTCPDRTAKCKFMDTHNAKARAEFEASMSKDEFKQDHDEIQHKEAADKSERRAHATEAVPKQPKDSRKSGEVKGQRYYLATSGGKGKGKVHMTRSSASSDPSNVDGVLWQLLRLVYNMFMQLARILFARRCADDNITIEPEAVCAAGASPLNELCYCGI